MTAIYGKLSARAKLIARMYSTREDWREASSTVEDIMEETGLSERTVRGVLDELLRDGRVTVAERPKQIDEIGRPAKVYDLVPV